MNYMRILVIFLVIGLISTGCASSESHTSPNQLRTPQYDAAFVPPPLEILEVPPEVIHTAGEVKTIAPDDTAVGAENDKIYLTPETVWQVDKTVTYNAFTLPEVASFDQSDCVGIVSIPKLSLNVNVYEAEDEMKAMEKGVAHFKSTTAWDGNIGLTAHNVNFDGSDGHFKYLYTLKVGDIVSYQTALGQREYTVKMIKNISEEDWSYLSRSTDNKLTLITCISGQPSKRLMVQAVEK